jgi:GNAT superfamily N-acetyltransferase
MLIRPAEEKDRSALTSLHIAEDIECQKEAPEVMRSFRLSALSSRARDIVLVAEDDGDVIGYFWGVALRIFDYRIGIVFYLFIDPSYRRHGIGRALLKEGIKEMHDLGVRRFWANPDAKNVPTRILLEAIGFAPGPEKVFYQLVEPGAHHEWDKA